MEVSEKVPIFAPSIHVIDYPVSFRVGAGPYRHRPVLKSCFGGSLFIIPLYKRLEEVAALNRRSFQKYRLVTFEHKDFHGVWVDFEIFLDATRQRNGTIIGCHVQQYVSCLADGFQKAVKYRCLSVNGLQVVHLEDALVLKDKVSSTNALGIAQGLSGLNGAKVVSFRQFSKCLDGNMHVRSEKHYIFASLSHRNVSLRMMRTIGGVGMLYLCAIRETL